jgi:hypothetical protein
MIPDGCDTLWVSQENIKKQNANILEWAFCFSKCLAFCGGKVVPGNLPSRYRRIVLPRTRALSKWGPYQSEGLCPGDSQMWTQIWVTPSSKGLTCCQRKRPKNEIEQASKPTFPCVWVLRASFSQTNVCGHDPYSFTKIWIGLKVHSHLVLWTLRLSPLPPC